MTSLCLGRCQAGLWRLIAKGFLGGGGSSATWPDPRRRRPPIWPERYDAVGKRDGSRSPFLPQSAPLRRSARWASLRWTRRLLGRGAGNPLLRGGCGFRPVRGCWNHMNDLVAAAFELVENFGQREDGAGVNVVQQQDAPAARLDTADG